MRGVTIPNHCWIDGKEVNLHHFVEGLFVPLEAGSMGRFLVKVVLKCDSSAWHTFDHRRRDFIIGDSTPQLTEEQRAELLDAVRALYRQTSASGGKFIPGGAVAETVS